MTLIAAPAGPDRVALTYRIGQHDNQPAVHDRYMAAAAVLGVAVV